MKDIDIYSEKEEEYFSHTRSELLKFIPENITRVLDVGCGKGGFGQLLKSKRKVEVWGIEQDSKSAEIAAKALDKVLNSDFESSGLSDTNEKFDLICFNDVLEHLVNPDNVLVQCRQHLTQSGHILASIPNIRWYPVILSLLRYRDFKYAEGGVMDKTHLRFFTKKSMIRLFESAGYEVVIIEGINISNFKYFNILNSLLFNTQSDMKYPQFALLCKLKNG